MRTLALLLLSAAAVGSDAHALRAGGTPPRRLQNDDISIVQYCGQCIWRGRIVCEARAQFLVREYGDMTLEEARVSILDECTADGSDKVTISLDAFCGDCPWLAMNFNCDSRVAYLMQNYQLSEKQAQQATVEKGECIDPDYVPEELREPETEDSGLSTGAIVGIVIAILAVLLCCIFGWYMYYRKWAREEEEKLKKVDEEAAVGENGKEVPPEAAPVPVEAKSKKPKRSGKGVSFGLKAPDPDGDTRNIASDDYHAGETPKKAKFADADTKFPKAADLADEEEDDEEGGGDAPDNAAKVGQSDTAEAGADEMDSPEPEASASDLPVEENVDDTPDDSAKETKAANLEP